MQDVWRSLTLGRRACAIGAWLVFNGCAPAIQPDVQTDTIADADIVPDELDVLGEVTDFLDAFAAEDLLGVDLLTDATEVGASADATQVFTDTTDIAAKDTAEVATADAAPEVEVAQCQPTELCDGLDNDCDGQTDEGFLGVVQGGLAPVGSPCGGGLSAGEGTIICKSLTAAACNSVHYDLDVVLAPPGATLSPLQAAGGFVDLSGQLPVSGLQVDKGTPAGVPYGSSPLALDLDGDGDLDVVWLDGMSTAQVWIQTAPWQFTASPLWSDDKGFVAAAALADGAKPQLLLGGGALALLERDTTGKWTNVAAARGLTMPAGTQRIQHLVPADVNNDGLLDVVGGVFACSILYPALYVWVDRGDGHFQESAQALGYDLHASVWADLFTDLDGAGLPALFVLTEGCEPHPGTALYRQQPPDTVPLYKIQKLLPIFSAPGAPGGTPMGASVADVNGDGVQDYLLTEIELHDFVANGGDVQTMSVNDPKIAMALSNHLLLSQPTGPRKQAGLQAGVWAPLSTTGVPMTAWAPIWSDLDHDGHLDLLLSHATEGLGWTTGHAGTMRPVWFRNDGMQHFVDKSAAIGLPKQHDGRAMVAADLDGDGDDDLLLGGHAVAPRILRNDIAHLGSDVRVRLRGHASNPWGLLARIQLETTLRTLTMEHSVQGLPQTMGQPVSHFSLQKAELPLSVTVTWPSGWVTQLPLNKAGMVEIDEPALFSLSTRWSPNGATPVVVQATQFAADGSTQSGAQCTIELAPGSHGAWLGPTTCLGAKCTRTWSGTPATTSGADTLVVGCGGKTWSVRPRIGY